MAVAAGSVAEARRVLAERVAAEALGSGVGQLELEWRLGRRGQDGRFCPGLPREAWERLRAALDDSPAFRCSFADTTETAVGMDRCIETHPPRGSPDAPSPPPRWMAKRRLLDVDCELCGGAAVRASLSLETPRPSQRAPPPPTGGYVRHKQRWSYRLCRHGEDECWRVDLTLVRGNLDGAEACEAEVELADARELYARPLPSVVEWGYRMAQDMQELAEEPMWP